MRPLTLIGLRVVREVAVAGSFTAAAESLGYTQSAISRQVAAMEAAAGTQLFERGPRGVVPSPAGAVLVRHATAVLTGVEAAEHELASVRNGLAGRVTVGAFPSASSVLVPRAFARLSREHPGLVNVLEEAATPVLLRRLRTRRVDVAVIGVGEGLPSYGLDGLRQEVLASDGLRIAVPDGHRLARQQRVRAADLEGELWIVGRGERGEPQFGAWPTLGTPRTGPATRSWATRLGMVAAGLGVSLLPALAAGSVPAGVRVLVVEDYVPSRRAVAVTQPDAPAAVGMVVVALTQEAALLRGAEPTSPPARSPRPTGES